tara:strand:- start:1700 stop:1942 length:243 start_codon:yes stop_codon:yes gene_type:complete
MVWTFEDTELLGSARDDISLLKDLKEALDSLDDNIYTSVIRDDGELVDRVEEHIDAYQEMILILEKRKLEDYNISTSGPI